jgi:hypothetical protein
VLNTPLGIVLRHNWLKNEKMYRDMQKAVSTSLTHSNKLSIGHLIDNMPFPNYKVMPPQWWNMYSEQHEADVLRRLAML